MQAIKRTKVIDVLRRTDYGATVNVKGWVRTRRGSKSVNFIALNDGSTIQNVQIVADVERFDEETSSKSPPAPASVLTASSSRVQEPDRPAKYRPPK